MSDYPVTRGARPGDPHLRLRLAALTAVITGVILVALAAFLFSYTGIHHIALQAGVAPGLARLYPLMFDAMLIITCSAVLATRTAGWGTKTYVWVCLLLVVGAVAVGDALYATGVHLTGQAARATIAVVPWVLLLLGFGIWLVMLRHWRRIRVAGAVNETEAARPAQADRNGHADRPVPAAPAGQPDRAPQPGQTDRAAQAMAASAAAGGAVSWAAGRGAAAARSRTPRVGIDTLLEQQAGRAPERPPAAGSPAAGRATAAGQDKQPTTAPRERQPAGTTAAAAVGTAAAAAAGTAAGIAAGTRGDSKPETAGETRPEATAPATPGPAAAIKPGAAAATTAAGTAAGTAAATRPGTAGTMPEATTGTTPGTVGTTPGTATTPGATAATPGAAAATPGTTETGADAKAGAGATAAATAAETGRDGDGKDEAPAQNRRRRLGGLLEMPADADDEAGSVRILPAEPKAPLGDAASGKNDEAGEAGPPVRAAAAATEPDPANPPAPLPHFDRPRSTPTPPRDTGTDGE
jgi:uncharacterized protein DUF2637